MKPITKSYYKIISLTLTPDLQGHIWLTLYGVINLRNMTWTTQGAAHAIRQWCAVKLCVIPISDLWPWDELEGQTWVNDDGGWATRSRWILWSCDLVSILSDGWSLVNNSCPERNGRQPPSPHLPFPPSPGHTERYRETARTEDHPHHPEETDRDVSLESKERHNYGTQCLDLLHWFYNRMECPASLPVFWKKKDTRKDEQRLRLADLRNLSCYAVFFGLSYLLNVQNIILWP